MTAGSGCGVAAVNEQPRTLLRGGMGLPSRAWRALRGRGVARSAQSLLDVLEDEWFERRHQVKTDGVHELDGLAIRSKNRQHGSQYMPVRVGHLRRVLKLLPIDPGRWNLVDLGSGKGRVLVLADLMGFEKSIGVEFAADLCNAATANKLAFEKRHGRSSGIEVRHADVTAMSVAAAPTVFYAYNPFKSNVMAQAVQRIDEARALHGQPAWFCYTNPAAPTLIDDLPGAKRYAEFSWGGESSIIWSLPAIVADV